MLVQLQRGARDPGDLLLRLAALAQNEGRVHVRELHELPAALRAAVVPRPPRGPLRLLSPPRRGVLRGESKQAGGLWRSKSSRLTFLFNF